MSTARDDFVQLPSEYHTLRQVGARIDGVNGSTNRDDLYTQLMRVRHERPSALNDAIRDADGVDLSGCRT